MQTREALRNELRTLIVEALNLEDITPGDIKDDTTLFGDGLGLDSIDALELGMAISKKYDITLSQDPEENQIHFANVENMADLVWAKLQEKA